MIGKEDEGRDKCGENAQWSEVEVEDAHQFGSRSFLFEVERGEVIHTMYPKECED